MDLSRSELLIGEAALKTLSDAKVLLLGLGGVGSYCLEGLVRGGIGELHIVDGDIVDSSNVNRQLLAIEGNYSKPKVQAAYERILSINPDCKVYTYNVKLIADSLEDALPLEEMDFIADAIDAVSVKIRLAEVCFFKNIPLISAMSTGNKLDPTAFKVGDIFETDVCPLCRVLRHELRSRGVDSLKVVYSSEKPKARAKRTDNMQKVISSVSFVPPVVGFIMAGEIIKSLIKVDKSESNSLIHE